MAAGAPEQKRPRGENGHRCASGDDLDVAKFRCLVRGTFAFNVLFCLLLGCENVERVFFF